MSKLLQRISFWWWWIVYRHLIGERASIQLQMKHHWYAEYHAQIQALQKGIKRKNRKVTRLQAALSASQRRVEELTGLNIALKERLADMAQDRAAEKNERIRVRAENLRLDMFIRAVKKWYQVSDWNAALETMVLEGEISQQTADEVRGIWSRTALASDAQANAETNINRENKR